MALNIHEQCYKTYQPVPITVSYNIEPFNFLINCLIISYNRFSKKGALDRKISINFFSTEKIDTIFAIQIVASIIRIAKKVSIFPEFRTKLIPFSRSRQFHFLLSTSTPDRDLSGSRQNTAQIHWSELRRSLVP